jgi:hypothetical protein
MQSDRTYQVESIPDSLYKKMVAEGGQEVGPVDVFERVVRVPDKVFRAASKYGATRAQVKARKAERKLTNGS